MPAPSSYQNTALYRHLTAIIFGLALCFSLVTITLLIFNNTPLFHMLLVVSIVFNGWCLYRSERSGFVHLREMRRAFEPPRHFNTLQIFTVVFLMMAQFGLGIYTFFR